MFTQSDLMDALSRCYVPALRMDVVAANLVRSAEILPDPDAPGAGIPGVPARFLARIILQAPGVDDAVNGQTRASVENLLLGLEELSRVELVFKPALFPILNG